MRGKLRNHRICHPLIKCCYLLVIGMTPPFPTVNGSAWIPHPHHRHSPVHTSGNSAHSMYQNFQKETRIHFGGGRLRSAKLAGRQAAPTILSVAAASAAASSSTSLLLGNESALSITYMVLLALQFAVQPIITQKYAPKTLIRSTYVMIQDVARLVISIVCLTITHSWGSDIAHWTWQGAVYAAGIPAVLYFVQSYCSLMAYQHLTPIAYNVLNQTKTLSAAFFCYILIQQRQSAVQMLALGILLLSALVMESIIRVPFLSESKPKKCIAELSSVSVKNADPSSTSNCTKVAQEENSSHPPPPPSSSASSSNSSLRKRRWLMGVVPVLAASLISGLAGAWTQKCLQQNHLQSSLFLTLQMSIVSIAVNGCLLCFVRASPDRVRAQTHGWWVGWSASTLVPICVNAIGGILVGLVTKYSGSVRKGFALIIGMFLSGILQNTFPMDEYPHPSKDGHNVSCVQPQQWLGGILAAISLYLHTSYPPSSSVIRSR